MTSPWLHVDASHDLQGEIDLVRGSPPFRPSAALLNLVGCSLRDGTRNALSHRCVVITGPPRSGRCTFLERLVMAAQIECVPVAGQFHTVHASAAPVLVVDIQYHNIETLLRGLHEGDGDWTTRGPTLVTLRHLEELQYVSEDAEQLSHTLAEGDVGGGSASGPHVGGMLSLLLRGVAERQNTVLVLTAEYSESVVAALGTQPTVVVPMPMPSFSVACDLLGSPLLARQCHGLPWGRVCTLADIAAPYRDRVLQCQRWQGDDPSCCMEVAPLPLSGFLGHESVCQRLHAIFQTFVNATSSAFVAPAPSVHEQKGSLDRGGSAWFRRVAGCSGVLLHGPSGGGKARLLQGMAHEFPALRFLWVASPLMFSKYYGDSERCVRQVFAAARQRAPCVLVLDEIDAVASSRFRRQNDDGGGGGGGVSVAHRVLSQILCEMDGIQGNSAQEQCVLVVGCTNCPLDHLDPAMLRNGRLEVLLELPALTPHQVLDVVQRLTGTFVQRDTSDSRVHFPEELFRGARSVGDVLRLVRERLTDLFAHE